MNETKLNGQSADIVSENIHKLKQIFPEVFCEDKIDFEKLRAVLGEYTDDDNERYNFTWWGKSRALRLAQTPSMGTLRPCKEESKDWYTTQNLYVEGDNLEVLKLLQKSYHGKVKMIYIDPPYNTGKDFVYPDDYHDPIQNYLEMTSQIDEKGRKLGTNNEAGGRYHTNWLNMMYPRLRLARNLLKEDGVILVSIDDNEANNLKKICDEIFGEENFVQTFYFQVRFANKSLTEKNDYQTLIEQLFIYKKSTFVPKKPSEEYSLDKFRYKVIEKGNGKTEIIDGKKVQIFTQEEYEILEVQPGINNLKETWASGTILRNNASGKFSGDHLNPRVNIDGYNVLYKVEGIGEDGLGFRYFTGPRKEGATKGKFFLVFP